MIYLQLIKDKCCDDMNLQLKLILEEKNMEKVTEESLEKKLNLITTVGTTNMHLFDRNGINIRKYKTPEESEYSSLLTVANDFTSHLLVIEIAPFCSSRRVLWPEA